MTFRLIRVDEALRGEHHYLTPDDECYCLGDYLPHAGYKAGPVNSLISNIKKPVSKRGLPEYRYKEHDIARAGQLVRSVLATSTPSTATFVPVPASKAKTDPAYDDRLYRILTTGTPSLDVRELLGRAISTRAHHEYAPGERRPTPDDLYRQLAIDEACLKVPLRATVIIFDDVLTNGTHFRACKRLIVERVPEAQVIGLFIGRRKIAPAFDVDLFDDQ